MSSVLAAMVATGIDLATGTVTRPEALDWAVWSSTVACAALAIAGGVLVVRLPRHLMSWLLIAGGLVAGGNGLSAKSVAG
ncbi:hypothetical protein ACIBEJ_06965 [Nonomuraea sp. NPDC050790]|uniref:hypothetical protein n=1 Tax=Nonomuraea sp. NPDC050790 TaxID=3364371 RepID=UPI003792C685